MKIRLTPRTPNPKQPRAPNSLEKRPPSKQTAPRPSPRQPATTSKKPSYLGGTAVGKIVMVSQQKTEVGRRRTRLPKQQPQFLKEFQEITRIYQQSQEIENEEEFNSLLCLDETLDDLCRPRRNQPPTSHRYSQKSVSLLPSIAEHDVEEEKDEDFQQSPLPTGKSSYSTATNPRGKNVRSVNEHYTQEFELRARSHEKKLTIDVLNLIKSRSKTKSSGSQRHPR